MNPKTTVSLLSLGLLAACQSGQKSQPNIVLILADDMGYSDISCYGSEVPTPNIDRLAENGIRFTQFYNTARCCPSRASLLTGLHPHQTGMGAMESDRGEDGYRGDINRHCVTIAEVLHQAGYRTYMAGKWHLTRFRAPSGPKHNWPLQRGFDRFYGTITGAGSYYDPTTLCRGNTYITPENDSLYHPRSFYYTDAITDNAIMFLKDHEEQSSDQPFFLYVAYTAAHWPMQAPDSVIQKYVGWYDKGYEPVRKARYERMKKLGVITPNTELSPAPWKWEERPNKEWESDMMEVYAAMIDCMDNGVGRIVDKLKNTGQLNHTLIIYLHDNGGCAERWLNDVNPEVYHGMSLKSFGPDDLQPRIWPPMQTRDGRPVICGPAKKPGGPDSYALYEMGWANVSNTPFRYYKHYIQEGGISTPLIFYWPDRFKDHGVLRTQMGQLMDIMATIVDAAGAVYPKTFRNHEIYPLEGVSLLPVAEGQTITHPPLFWEHEGNCGVRKGDWKLVITGHHKMDPIPFKKWELYNISEDRAEMHNLAVKHPDIVQELSDLWYQWAHRAHVIPYPH
ncbi:MAG: arylsulfatase [Bacteroidales bacterium]|nr:arylsulfatase [Bacteroidales bacterium]